MTASIIKPIKKLLIANRGEIACRIIRTAKSLGIETALICSEPDAHSLASTLADTLFVIGPAEASKSYLDHNKIIAVAHRWQADAVHPGYGFLSENADFAQALAAENILFIGPPAQAMANMASKSEAKRLMAQAGVPLLNGYHGQQQDDDTLRQAADKIGYPVMLKAAAGGGGKGMRIVLCADEFSEALAAARREAEKAFGDTIMLVERYLPAPRHIEVQIFFDQHGQGVYLFDRDCSIQRRHQKVIEEAPAPDLTDDLRKRMGEAALAAGHSIDYVGAGTVEFLLEGDRFYFMEMNTRLQVEHPVTEMITGQDLVAWQIHCAEGHPLPCSQDQLESTGHSLEVRLYAEEPAKEFLPTSGTISHLKWPAAEKRPWLRIETGVRAGDKVTHWYDPMIAKLVVWGQSRQQACERMIDALEQTHMTGLPSNRDFLLRILQQPAFQKETPDTGFIPSHQQLLLPIDQEQRNHALIAATVAALPAEQSAAEQGSDKQSSNKELWHGNSGWRLNGKRQWYGCWCCEGEQVSVAVSVNRYSQTTAVINGQSITVDSLRIKTDRVEINGHPFFVYRDHDRQQTVISSTLTLTLTLPDYQTHDTPGMMANALMAPMNGRIVSVLVLEGQAVAEGDPLVILEAMKMEQTIRAPHAGIIESILHPTGSLVEQGTTLLSFQDGEANGEANREEEA